MRLEELHGECEKLGAELENQSPLTGKETAAYLNRFSRLFFDASITVKSRQEAKEFSEAITRSMSWLYYRVKSKKLKALFGAGHGTMEVSHKPFIVEPDLSRSRAILRYNCFHWAGLAGILDPSAGFPVGSHPHIGLTALPDGRIRLSKKLLTEMFYHTSHYVETGLHRSIPISVDGTADLTPREFFALSRAVSNSLRSLAYNRVMHDVIGRIGLDAFETHPKYEELHGIMKGRGVDYWKRTVIYELSKNKLLAPLLPFAHKGSSLSVRLHAGGAIVEDSGLGKPYSEIAGMRALGGTSALFQKQAVKKIRRTYGTSFARTELVFRRPR